MSDATHGNEHTVSTRTVELVVAGALMALAAVIMWDNWRIGATWGSSGPGAGYFPFRIGALLFLVSAGTFVMKLRNRTAEDAPFVERSQLRSIMKVFIPTLVFVGLIPFLGIYVASALFIAFFMRWLGHYPYATIVPVAVGVPLLLFFMFEVWFLVPLLKGPLETALGY